MFEISGWITVAETTYEIDDGNLSRIVDEIEAEVLKQPWLSDCVTSRKQNGNFLLSIRGIFNHDDVILDSLINLFRTTAVLAPGSYGLLYAANDEFAGDWSNRFRVWVLRRGTICEAEDPFLSPITPMIED